MPKKRNFTKKLNRLGIIGQDAEFEDVLHINVEDVLKRRLQTQVYERGLASTVYQARQFIVHGHVQVNGKKITAPSYIVKREEEDTISFVASSSLAGKKAEVKEKA